jgi:hypothetical protein
MAFFNIAAAVATVAQTYMSVQGQRAAADAAEDAAEWNADKARKEAAYTENQAQENLRRKRENNRRQLARQRATGARSGTTEAGAVGDMLVDSAERMQQDVDDIWKEATLKSEYLENQALMSEWEGKQAKASSKYAIYGTIAKGAVGVAGSLANTGMFSGAPKPNPNQVSPLKALPYKP